jgi:signal transduction histidine kinase/DNA-binding response OmpR family regulator
MNELRAYETKGEILVVDDDLASVRALSALLVNQGHEVRQATDGPTALMIAAADPPELILLDVLMPGMDGFEVCQRLRGNNATADLPVIFVSGLDEMVDKVRGFEAGGVDYITKPFQAEEVGVRVQTHLTLYRLQRELDQRNYKLRQEIGERRQAEAALQARTGELGERVKELSALISIAQAIATNADLQVTLETVAEQVTRLYDARITLFTVPDHGDVELHVVAGHDRVSGQVETTPPVFALEETPNTRLVLEQGRPIVLSQVQSLELAPSVRAFVDERDLQTILVVPLRTRGMITGVLTVGSDQVDRVFGEGEIKLAETIAADVASALENARLAEEAQAAAVDAERQRLARELHDSVTQSLYSLTLLSNGWGTMAEQGRLEDPAGSFRQVGQVGQQALKEMRLMIHQLRPPILEEVGLVGALQQRLEAVEQRSTVETQLLVEGDVDGLPDEIEEQLFYIGQEALNNSLRHAGATDVIVRIEAEDDQIRLYVEDNGQGFDPGADSAGVGLSAMQERAEAIGGRLTVTSAPQGCTTVELLVALERDEGV